MRPPGNAHFSLEVAFELRQGVHVLFGPSGAGKSTIVAAIAGLLRPDAGRIAFGEEVWFDAQRSIWLPANARKVSLVFQSLALFPHMSALANVEYGLPRTLSRVERRERAMAMLQRMQVAHLAPRRPATFSGGEAQRVALARAFAREPSLLLLDESFSAMDRKLRSELGAELRRYVEERSIPAILITHHRMEAHALGESILLVEGGRILGQGALSELLPLGAREEGG